MVGSFDKYHIKDDCFPELTRILKPGLSRNSYTLLVTSLVCDWPWYMSKITQTQNLGVSRWRSTSCATIGPENCLREIARGKGYQESCLGRVPRHKHYLFLPSASPFLPLKASHAHSPVLWWQVLGCATGTHPIFRSVYTMYADTDADPSWSCQKLPWCPMSLAIDFRLQIVAWFCTLNNEQTCSQPVCQNPADKKGWNNRTNWLMALLEIKHPPIYTEFYFGQDTQTHRHRHRIILGLLRASSGRQ